MDSFYIFLFSKVASTEVFVAIVVILGGILLFKKHIRAALTLLGGAAGMGCTVWALKLLVAAPRMSEPIIEATGYAFPSGHAAASVFLATIAFSYVSRIRNVLQRVGLSAVIIGLTSAIAASRIIYNVHTPLQVLAGASIGFLWGIGTYLLMERLKGHQK